MRAVLPGGDGVKTIFVPASEKSNARSDGHQECRNAAAGRRREYPQEYRESFQHIAALVYATDITLGEFCVTRLTESDPSASSATGTDDDDCCCVSYG